MTNRMATWATTLVGVLATTIAEHPVLAQVTVAEINPVQSTLHPTNPNGASGGRVNGIGYTANGRTLFAATEWGGLYRSDDSGRTWAYVPGHRPMAMWDVEVDPTDSRRVYATSFYDGRVQSRAGINVSTDGGRSWLRPATATPPAGFCTAARRTEPSAFGISIDPDDHNNVYIGTNCGLAVSTNRGLTWTFVDPTPGSLATDVWDVVVHDGGIIDVCGDDRHRRSVDGGVTWTGGTVVVNSGGCSIAVSPDESYVLFVVAGLTIYESDDAGATWRTLTNPRAQGRIPFVETNQRSGNTFDLWFGDVQLDRASCTTPTVPAQGGAARCPQNAWTGPFTTTAGAHADAGDLVFDPRTPQDACPLLYASDGGVYYNSLTASPGCHSPQWNQPTVTPRALWLFAMDGAHQTGAANEDLYMGLQDNGTFATQDAPAASPTWTNVDCCDSPSMEADPSRVGVTTGFWSPPPAFRLFTAAPGLVNELEINTYPAGNLRAFAFLDGVEQWGPDDFAVVTSTGLFVTQNIDANPIVWSNQLGAATSPAQLCNVKAGVTGGTPTFYAQSSNVLQGCDDRNRNAKQLWRYVGTAANAAWTQVVPPGGGAFGVFDVDPGNPNRLIAAHIRAGQPPQMILTTDGGNTWTNLTALDELMTGGDAFQYANQRGPTNFTGFNGYEQPTLVAFDPGDEDVIVAGAADAGVFLSLDGGTSWELVTDPFNSCCSGRPHISRPRFAYFDHERLPSERIGRLDLASLLTNTINIYVGTQGRGVWRVTVKRPNILTACKIFPNACAIAQIDRGVIDLITLECVTLPCAIITDPIPKNCLVKFDCPGCEGLGLCPPYYEIELRGLDRDVWEVGLFRQNGEPLAYELFEDSTRVVMTFRPDRRDFKPGSIADYQLVFARMTPGPALRQRIAAELRVRDTRDRAVGRLREGLRDVRRP